MSTEGSSVKASSQQNWTTGPKLKGGGPLFSGLRPLIMGGGLVNDTTPVSVFYLLITANSPDVTRQCLYIPFSLA